MPNSNTRRARPTRYPRRVQTMVSDFEYQLIQAACDKCEVPASTLTRRAIRYGLKQAIQTLSVATPPRCGELPD